VQSNSITLATDAKKLFGVHVWEPAFDSFLNDARAPVRCERRDPFSTTLATDLRIGIKASTVAALSKPAESMMHTVSMVFGE
jgi:hypothetical protein